MEKTNSNKIKLIYLIAFFALNLISSSMLTTNLILENLSPFPRTIFMVINSFFGDFGFLLLFLGLAIFIFRTDYNRAKFLMISSIVFCIIYFGLSVYFQHYNMFFSFYNLSAFGSDAGGDAVGFILSSLLMLLTSAKFIFLLSGFLIVFVFIRLFRKNRSDLEFKSSSLVIGRDRVIIGLGLALAGVLIMASGLSAFRVEIEDTWYEDNSTPLYGTQAVGLFNYYIYEGYTYLTKQFDDIPRSKYEHIEGKLEEYKNPLNISPVDGSEYGDSEYAGVFEDKNLMLIQLESFNNFVVGLEIEIDGNFVEITPNINRIVKESIYFNNYYTSVGIGNTADSEFTILSGLYPIGNDYIIYDHDKVQYPMLPNLFKDKDYYTFSAHANTNKFYERGRVHTSLYGFDKHYGKEDLDVSDDRLIHTWLNDTDLLMQSIDIFNNESKNGKVFSHIITVTNHMPYGKPSEALGENWFFDRLNIIPSDFSIVDNLILNQQIIGYLEHIAYVDYAIGMAMERIVELGLHEDTIIMLYGDHGSDIDAHEMFYQSSDILFNGINDMIEYTYNPEDRVLQNRLLNANIPFIIYDPSSNPVITPEIKPMVRGTNTASRTISSLFNLDPEYYFGIDALSEAKTYAYNPRNLDIYADGIIISGQSLEYYIVDQSYKDFYTKDKIDNIIDKFREYKDFNDKLIKYRVFPPLE